MLLERAMLMKEAWVEELVLAGADGGRPHPLNIHPNLLLLLWHSGCTHCWQTSRSSEDIISPLLGPSAAGLGVASRALVDLVHWDASLDILYVSLHNICLPAPLVTVLLKEADCLLHLLHPHLLDQPHGFPGPQTQRQVPNLSRGGSWLAYVIYGRPLIQRFWLWHHELAYTDLPGHHHPLWVDEEHGTKADNDKQMKDGSIDSTWSSKACHL